MLSLILASLLWTAPQEKPARKSVPASAGAEARIQEMIDKAGKKEPKDQPLPMAEVANELADLADLYYGENDFDRAETTLKRLVGFAEKSAAAAKGRGKKIKNAEIELRKCQRKLEALRHSLSVADQGPVVEAEKRIEQSRSDLMAAMFSPRKP